MVVGIDFGTTFTGVAYAQSGSINLALGSSKIADKVIIIRGWPGANSQAEKTPTILSYHTSPPTWGAKVKTNDGLQVSRFKLGLQENIEDHYSNCVQGLNDELPEGSLSSRYWSHPLLPQKKPLDYVADYLTCVCQYVLNDRLPRQFGSEFLQNQQISYVLTVPAIWSEKAKELTREAALRAGVPRRDLTLITEPEAAALYCATLCNEVDLHIGDRFLVCDAGGGTVVCLSSVFSDSIGSYILWCGQESPFRY